MDPKRSFLKDFSTNLTRNCRGFTFGGSCCAFDKFDRMLRLTVIIQRFFSCEKFTAFFAVNIIGTKIIRNEKVVVNKSS
jgi:hypothetical protein